MGKPRNLATTGFYGVRGASFSLSIRSLPDECRMTQGSTRPLGFVSVIARDSALELHTLPGQRTAPQPHTGVLGAVDTQGGALHVSPILYIC